LIVIVEVADPVPDTLTGFGLNAQMGGIVTKGVIELHESVMPAVPVGVTYPLIGLMLIVPCPPLPAGTEVGVTALVTEMVNWGATASTVTVCADVVIVCDVEGAVPVIVMA